MTEFLNERKKKKKIISWQKEKKERKIRQMNLKAEIVLKQWQYFSRIEMDILRFIYPKRRNSFPFLSFSAIAGIHFSEVHCIALDRKARNQSSFELVSNPINYSVPFLVYLFNEVKGWSVFLLLCNGERERQLVLSLINVLCNLFCV